jgi:hypothetical protein
MQLLTIRFQESVIRQFEGVERRRRSFFHARMPPHTLIPDGSFVISDDGPARFVPLPAPVASLFPGEQHYRPHHRWRRPDFSRIEAQ